MYARFVTMSAMNTLPYVIIGGGGHTRVLIGMLQMLEKEILGIVTQNEALLGTEILGVPVLGREGEVPLSATGVVVVNGVGNQASAQGSGLDVRQSIFERYRRQEFTLPAIVGPHAIVSPGVTLGDAVQVMHGAILQPGSAVGANSIVNSGAIVEHDAAVGDHCHLAPGAILCGGAVLGEGTHVGAGAVVLQGVRVGSHAVIAAGAVVRRDVADGAIFRP